MPSLKITYFDMRGRAEILRLACVVGGLDFDDHRISFADFKEMRPNTPYKALPIMEIDGKVAAQSASMLRYLGKLSKLYPECSLAALMVDEVLDTMEDFNMTLFKYRGDDKKQLRAQRAIAAEESAPRYIGGLEKRLEEFGGKGPWAIGNGITIADFVITNMVNNFKSGFLEFISSDTMDSFPRIMASYNATMAHPKVAEWYKLHPIKGVTE